MAHSFLKNEADAEDVAQEAFLTSFRSEAKFGTWLINSRSQSINLHR
jgi:RNA polymerase sigma-70 factor (ECF subfamily)